MKLGLIGFTRSGKTTVFNALTGAHAAVGAFGSREANVAVIKVPDPRVDALAEVYRPKKKTWTEIEFLDVAPDPHAAAALGEAKVLDNTALPLLRTVEALVHVVRAFQAEAVVHPLGGVDPARDCRMLEEELILSDLLIVEKRVARLEKEHRRDREYELLLACREVLEPGKALRTADLGPHDEAELSGFAFLTRKPLLLLGNYGEAAIGSEDPAGLRAHARETGLPLIELCGEMEFEIAQLPEADRQAFRDDLGLGEESRSRFIHTAYDVLGLISFLTMNEAEVRAWTLPRGAKALDAAGVVHTDMRRGFIRAEVVGYENFIRAGSMAKAKEQGHVRLEGKDYTVRDGDIILFRFNV